MRYVEAETPHRSERLRQQRRYRFFRNAGRVNTNSSTAVATMNAPLIGLVKKTVGSPSESGVERRRFSSSRKKKGQAPSLTLLALQTTLRKINL